MHISILLAILATISACLPPSPIWPRHPRAPGNLHRVRFQLHPGFGALVEEVKFDGYGLKLVAGTKFYTHIVRLTSHLRWWFGVHGACGAARVGGGEPGGGGVVDDSNYPSSCAENYRAEGKDYKP